MKPAHEWITELRLQSHPEGGYFRETFRSEQSIQIEKNGIRKTRSAGTVIYYLLEGHQKSVFHRLQCEEIWYFHAGCPLEIARIQNDGNSVVQILGPHTGNNQQLHIAIPAQCWFGAAPTDPKGYTLVSCSVSPGFEFEDFEIADREQLIAQFPQHTDLIKTYTDAK